MEWTSMIPFPLALIFQVVFLTTRGAASSWAVFAGYRLARRRFQWKVLVRGIWVRFLRFYERVDLDALGSGAPSGVQFRSDSVGAQAYGFMIRMAHVGGTDAAP